MKVTVDGKELEVYPEADIVALKEKHAEELKSHLAQIEELKKTGDGHYQKVLQHQIEAQKLADEQKKLATELEQLRPLSKTVEGLKTQLTDTETKLVNATAERIMLRYNLTEADLKGKTMAEMTNLEAALKLVASRNPNYFAGGGNFGGGSLSELDQLAARYPTMKVK